MTLEQCRNLHMSVDCYEHTPNIDGSLQEYFQGNQGRNLQGNQGRTLDQEQRWNYQILKLTQGKRLIHTGSLE